MNTKDEPGAFDVLAEAKAAPDEPKFTLWARDPSAAPLVMEWAKLNRERVFAAEADMTPEKRKLELIQSTEAEEIAWQMEEWRRGEVAAAPSEEDAPAPSYVGNAMGAEELAAKEQHDDLLAAARSLDNALSIALEAGEVAKRYGFAMTEGWIGAAAYQLRDAAQSIRPSRPSYAHMTHVETVVVSPAGTPAE